LKVGRSISYFADMYKTLLLLMRLLKADKSLQTKTYASPPFGGLAENKTPPTIP